MSELIPGSTRICAQCDVEKPLSLFVADRRKQGGRGYQCKECRKGYRTGDVKWPGPMYSDRYASAARARIAKLGLAKIEPWPIPMNLRAGSIATGIGGLELGIAQKIDRLELAWISETDPACTAVLRRHWSIPNLGDSDLVDWAEVEPVDILITGFPCQPFSFAGLRKAEDDHRDLWPTVAIAIREIAPSYVFIENVPGFLAGPVERTVRFLAQAGYVGRWVSVRSLDVGAPHVRERTFLLAAHTDAIGGGRPALAESSPPGGGAVQHGAGADRSGCVVGGISPFPGPGWEGEWGWFEPVIRRWEIMHGPAPAPVTPDGIPSVECAEWVMGFPQGWTEGSARTVRGAMLGNSCCPEQAGLGFEILRG